MNQLSGCFHAVGNGTFFIAKIYDTNDNVFIWGYDCGSISSNTINEIINSSDLQLKDGDVIDMMVISHFDDDHVNGLMTLLRKYSIKRLVLPYSEWTQAIREISINGKNGVSPSVALLQLNPELWLQHNKLLYRVKEIILVQGGSEPMNHKDTRSSERLIQNSSEFVILNDNEEELHGLEHEIHMKDAKDNVFFDLGRPIDSGKLKLSKINHMQSVSVLGGGGEFLFYNAEKEFKDLKLVYEKDGEYYAKVSHCKLTDAKQDIQQTIESINLHHDITSSLDVEWREKLKACYQKHFGSTRHAQNNISLCMYASPKNTIVDCGYIFNHSSARYNTHALGLIFTGDINLTEQVLSDFESHLGSQRWMNRGLFQIPHHGSAYCWKKGYAKRIKPAYFIQCANPTSKQPSQLVLDDLKSENSIVCNASKKYSVHLNFYFINFF